MALGVSNSCKHSTWQRQARLESQYRRSGPQEQAEMIIDDDDDDDGGSGEKVTVEMGEWVR